MRPAGEVRQALLRAAVQLATPDRGPTMRELASAACVGYSVARRTVDHMKRSGELRVARERKVDYRNRPVAEYAPWSATGVTSPDGYRLLVTAWRAA